MGGRNTQRIGVGGPIGEGGKGVNENERGEGACGSQTVNPVVANFRSLEVLQC
jgi:hypothetical protein